MDEILKENEEFERIIAELKKESAYYPQVLVKRYGERLYCSTLVRINRDNRWYVVYCVENIVSTKDVTEKHLMLKMMESVHKIEFLYKTTGVFEEVDGLQQSETGRLLGLSDDFIKEKCNFEQICVHESEEIERRSDGFIYEACFKCGCILDV